MQEVFVLLGAVAKLASWTTKPPVSLQSLFGACVGNGQSVFHVTDSAIAGDLQCM